MKQSTEDSLEIRGKVVILRKFTEQMISDEYIGWLNDKKLMIYSEQRSRNHTRESCLDYMKSFETSPGYFWSIHRLQDDKHIGNISAYLNENQNTAELAVLIGDRSMGRTGAGKEAWGLAMEFLFNEVNVRKVVAGTMARNIAMVKVAEYNNMILEGTLREHFLFDGESVDCLCYGILKREWLAARAAKADNALAHK